MKTSTLLKETETGFDEARLKSWPVPDVLQAYDDRDTMLYALSVGAGLGRDDELRFVFENGTTELAALPTMAAIIATPGFWLMDDGLGIDWSSVLHGERSEEHTSELQSLMRISYAVFCLKKKRTDTYRPM